MKIIFYGGSQAGMIALLTLSSLKKHKIICTIPVDEKVELVANGLFLNIKKPKDINSNSFIKYLHKLNADLFVCCHGKQIIKEGILNNIKAINVHPCLYKYKGARPIYRMLKDGIKKASVGIHWMTKEVDQGKVIIEEFKTINGNSEIEIYNELYPLYSTTLIKAIKIISSSYD